MESAENTNDRRENIKARRKIFFGNLKEYVNKRKAVKGFEEKYYEITKEGEVVIKVNASEGVFSPYADKADLEPAMLDYIENSAYYVPVDRPLKVRFTNVKPEDKDAVQKGFNKHFTMKFDDVCVDEKINRFKTLVLLFLGVMLLAAGIVTARLIPNYFFNEILTVAASFTIWESVDFFLLERAAIKMRKLDIAQLLLAKVEINESEPQD